MGSPFIHLKLLVPSKLSSPKAEVVTHICLDLFLLPQLLFLFPHPHTGPYFQPKSFRAAAINDNSNYIMRFPPLLTLMLFSGLITELVFPLDNLHYLGCKQMGSLLPAIGLCERTVLFLYQWV